MYQKKVDNAAFPGLMSNHHLHHVAGYAIALTEMREYGEAYASQTIKNAKALAGSMSGLGFSVRMRAQGLHGKPSGGGGRIRSWGRDKGC